MTDVYNDEDFNREHGFADVETNIYTVGLGVSGITGNARDLAFATLDPLTQLPEQDQTGANNILRSFADAMNAYAGGGTPTVTVNSGTGSSSRYLVRQVSGEIGSGSGNVLAERYNPTYEDLRYNTTFDAPNTAEELVNVFERIAEEVLTEAPVLPIETTTPDPNTDGYVTFTDPLGRYMRVTDMDSIVFCSLLQEAGAGADCTTTEFTEYTEDTNGNITTYTFGGSYQANDLFPSTALSNMVVTVEHNRSLRVGDIITWRIPVALLPMLNATILEDADGTPRSMSWYNSHPVHLYYKVAPKAGVAAALTDPTLLSAADRQALNTYVAANIRADHTLRFYANAFSTAENGTPTSQTTVNFRPSSQNDFYRFGHDSVLYTEPDLGATITQEAWDLLDPDDPVYRTVYQYRTTGAQGSAPEKELIFYPTTKQNLLNGQTTDATVHESDGVMVGGAGMYNLSQRIYNLDMPKCSPDRVVWTGGSIICPGAVPEDNRTETDSEARATTVVPGTAGSVQIRLGNNGSMDYPVPGAFEIAKNVTTAQDGLSPDPEAAFNFTVTLTDAEDNALTGTYPFRVFDTATGDPVGEPGEIADSETITLTDGQHARIMGLPDGAVYSVAEEEPPPGFTSVPPSPTDGTINVPEAATDIPRLIWENEYDVSPAVISTVSATKLMAPEWLDGTYTMQLCPRFGAPTPADGDEETGCATADVTAEGQVVDFGNVTFERPDTYSYTLRELPTTVVGVTDSLAQYHWDVTVTDAGDGTLATSSTLTRTADDTGAPASEQVEPPATFTNTWTTGDLALQIVKRVHDSSINAEGETRVPEIPYTFMFDTVAQEGQTPPAPTFPGGDASTEVTSAAGNPSTAAPPLTFNPNHVGNTYFYKVEESQGADIPGMALSDAVWFFQVQVGSVTDTDGTDRVAPVATICETTRDTVTDANPWGDCAPGTGTYTAMGEGPLFVNTYTPDPGTAQLTATKILDGRAWDETDSFTFDLTPFDDATQRAIDDEVIELPDPTTATATAPASGSNPNVIFDDITFHQQGTYRFSVTERAPEDPIPGLVADTRAVVYVVTVTDEPVDGGTSRDGQLEAEVSVENGEATFVNTFISEVLFTNAVITKTLTGREANPGEFSIVVRALDAASQDKLEWDTASQTFTNTADAPDGQPAPVTQLPQILFTQADLGEQYSYLVTEEDSGVGGVAYDGTEYTVLIEPQYDIDTDEMWVRTTVSAAGETVATYDSRTDGPAQVGFENTYAAGPGTASIPFEKRIVGRDWREGDTFAFELTGLDGAPMPTDATAEVTEDSATVRPGIRAGELGPIEFTEPGTYTYEIREIEPTDDPVEGIIYDTGRVLTVTVEVTDDRSGTLQTAVSYASGTDRIGLFENLYQAWTLEKTSDPESGSVVQPGSTVTYTLTATNIATSTLTGAQAVDDLSEVLPYATVGDLPEGLELSAGGTSLVWTIPDLDPDETATVTYTATINEDATGATIRNSVTGAGDVPPPEDCPEDDADCRTTEVHTPGWTLTKDSDPASGSTVLPGETITYTLAAANTSEVADLSGALATDDLSEVLPYATLGDLPDGLTLDGTTLTWAIGDLGPGEDTTISYTVTIHENATGQTLRNAVTGAGDAVPPPDPCPEDNQDCRQTEHLAPAWSLAKTSDPASGEAVRPGDPITYTLTATNTGPAPVTGTTAIDDLSEVLPYASMGDLPEGLALSADGTSLVWTVPDLAVGEEASVSYTVTLDEDTWGSTVRNSVSGTGPVDPDACTTDDPCTTEHLVPLWTLNKTSDPASGTQVAPGTTIAYTLTVVNDGPAAVSDAEVTDDLSDVLDDAGLVQPLPDGLTLDGATLTWQVPSLAVGEQAEVTYSVLVNDDAYDAQLRNVATPGDGGGCETCSTEHETSAAPTPPGPTPPGPTPPGPAPIPPTGVSGVLGLAILGLGLVIGGGLLVRKRRRSGA